MRTEDFRKDINGLRAYAIIFVVLYHFNVPIFKAGFIGVDIFFVISGYLMTKIIASGLIANNFRFGSFFLSRCLRIVPPVVLVVLGVYIVSLFILTPAELRDYAKYITKALTFSSNFALLDEANNYFSSDGQDNLLLHTWSLSVEWQFYLLYPFFLWAGFKTSQNKKKITLALAVLLALSLAACLIMTERNQFHAFYMLDTRAWEMLAGGLVYFCKNRSKDGAANAVPFYAGVLAILASLSLFNEHTAWPGYAASLTVAGTALILYAERQAAFLFGGKSIGLIGLSSYSTYLWHWPVRYFLHYTGAEPGMLYTVCAVILSLALGLLSYFLIEKKLFLWLKGRKPLTALAVICLSLAVMLPVSDYTRKSFGLPWRGGAAYTTALDQLVMANPKTGWCFYSVASMPSLKIGADGVQCHIGDAGKGTKKALLFGDSFAGMYLPFWDALGKKSGLDVQAITTNWCNPSDGKEFWGPKTSTAYQQCLYNRDYVTKNIATYDYIIVAGAWSGNFANPEAVGGLRHFINFVGDKKVIIMAEPYQFGLNIGDLYKRSVWNKQRFDITPYITPTAQAGMKHADDILEEINRAHPNVLYLTREDLFDKTQYANGDMPYSLDGGHISVAGSAAAEKFFSSHKGKDKFESFLNR